MIIKNQAPKTDESTIHMDSNETVTRRERVIIQRQGSDIYKNDHPGFTNNMPTLACYAEHFEDAHKLANEDKYDPMTNEPTKECYTHRNKTMGGNTSMAKLDRSLITHGLMLRLSSCDLIDEAKGWARPDKTSISYHKAIITAFRWKDVWMHALTS